MHSTIAKIVKDYKVAGYIIEVEGEVFFKDYRVNKNILLQGI